MRSSRPVLSLCLSALAACGGNVYVGDGPNAASSSVGAAGSSGGVTGSSAGAGGSSTGVTSGVVGNAGGGSTGAADGGSVSVGFGSAEASTAVGVTSAEASVTSSGSSNADAASSPALFPARVVFFYTPLGTVLGSWRPTPGSQGDFSLSPILKPLEPFKDRILVVDGIDNLVHPGVPTNTDTTGPALLLTGQASNDSTTAGAESLSMFLGSRSSSMAAFTSITLGVESGVAIDFSGPNAPVFPRNNPAETVQRLFAQSPEIVAQFPSTTDFAAVGRQQMDLVRLAFQYDLTRSMTLGWSDIDGKPLFNWIAGVDKDLRTLAASSGSLGPDRDHFVAVETWFAVQFAYLVNRLASTPEGSGSSLLDHTLVVWVSETGEASERTGTNIPVVIAGNLLGRFRSGAYVQTHGSQANLLATIVAAAGIGPARFGDPALGNDSIAALLKP